MPIGFLLQWALLASSRLALPDQDRRSLLGQLVNQQHLVVSFIDNGGTRCKRGCHIEQHNRAKLKSVSGYPFQQFSNSALPI